MPTDTHTSPAASAPKPRTSLLRYLPFALLLMLAPAASQTQTQGTRGCPRFARVPGYGACNNTGGSSCGFCTYRCNDETVVRWNVCAL